VQIGGPDIDLTSSHLTDMVFHMKTTLNIDETVMARLRRESARTGRTMSELVETALRRLLQSRPERPPIEPLPSWNSGGALVDVADRAALYQAMEGR
jgi:hypothetical protein